MISLYFLDFLWRKFLPSKPVNHDIIQYVKFLMLFAANSCRFKMIADTIPKQKVIRSILEMVNSGCLQLLQHSAERDVHKSVIEQPMDEKLGRTVTRVALQRVFRHSRHHYGTYSENFTRMELEDGADRRTSGKSVALSGT
ncbi:hypothetical protein Tco_0233800 [Tanacetum coccineum]